MGFGAGVLFSGLVSRVHPATILVFTGALSTVYAWRINLRSMPEAFDFEQYADDLDDGVQVAQHALVAMLAVSAGTVLGVLALRVTETMLPSVNLVIGAALAMVVSYVLGMNVLLKVNEDYLVDS